METIEQALREFLVPWRRRGDVQGALLSGSFAFGTSTSFSDVDVHIVLGDRVRWRERGNCVVNGVLIEYLANPPSQLKKYADNDFRMGRRLNARMFALGRVLFDKTGVVTRLQKAARATMGRSLSRPSRRDSELGKYGLWDSLDGLKEAGTKRSLDYRYLYYLHLDLVLTTYARFLTDPLFRQGQQLAAIPDRRFCRNLINALDNGERLRDAETLTHYVLRRMGGFNIDGWKLRSPTEV